MTQELIKCPCCERMVPADNIELTFKMPDAVASMDDDEIHDECVINDDLCVCEDQYHYVRCVLPLPVHDKGEDYYLGVWVQVSPNSFDRIYELWDDEDQANEAPIQALLANEIPLTTGSINAEVVIQLIGTKTRPYVTVTDKDCSLFKEQTCGISIHRASEYSDLCR